jgi:hypothetical protein
VWHNRYAKFLKVLWIARDQVWTEVQFHTVQWVKRATPLPPKQSRKTFSITHDLTSEFPNCCFLVFALILFLKEPRPVTPVLLLCNFSKASWDLYASPTFLPKWAHPRVRGRAPCLPIKKAWSSRSASQSSQMQLEPSQQDVSGQR